VAERPPRYPVEVVDPARVWWPPSTSQVVVVGGLALDAAAAIAGIAWLGIVAACLIALGLAYPHLERLALRGRADRGKEGVELELRGELVAGPSATRPVHPGRAAAPEPRPPAGRRRFAAGLRRAWSRRRS
jgi:hypothetical protein